MKIFVGAFLSLLLIGCTMKHAEVVKAEERCHILNGSVEYVKNGWFPGQVQSVNCEINGNLFTLGNY